MILTAKILQKFAGLNKTDVGYTLGVVEENSFALQAAGFARIPLRQVLLW